MFINPKLAIEKGWIKGIKDPQKQIQPNAVDFTLDKVYQVDGMYKAVVSETKKMMRPLVEVPTLKDPNSFVEGWMLTKGTVYDGTSDVYVEVPAGVAAIIYTRSTLARNGIFLVSGLYDSGYKGQIGFTIYPVGGDTVIEPGTRVGQIAFIHSESAGLYAGGYNHEQGTHYIHKSTLAQELEQTHRAGSDQTSKPAGTKGFI